MPAPLLIGHRGAAGLAPENTLPSFRKALDLGLRAVELDVRLTRDRVLIVFHDDRLDRLTPLRGPVAERDWRELSGLPVLPGAFGGAFPDARIPTLEEVLAALPPECRVVVELKADPVRPAELVRETLAVLAGDPDPRRLRVISFEQDLLRRARSEGGVLELGILARPAEMSALLPRAREVGARALHPHFSAVDGELVHAAAEEGFRVSTWTVNNADEARRLAELGVEELATDYPDRLLAALWGPA